MQSDTCFAYVKIRHFELPPSKALAVTLDDWNNYIMQMICAVIKPFKLEDVRESLSESGVDIVGMTVANSRGFGRQKGQSHLYKGAEYVVNFLPKLIVMILVPDDIKERAIEAITKAAITGKVGDGIIWAIPFDKYLRIRTGEFIDNEGTHSPDE